MGMHPRFEREDTFLLADILFRPEKIEVVKTLIERKLISLDNLTSWEKLLSRLQVDSPEWFKLIDYLKIRIDAATATGGFISEKSPLDIVNNYKTSSRAFDDTFFTFDNFKGKVALDFGAGVYRPFCVAVILFANGFDRTIAFEPFALKNDFPCASLMKLINEMLMRPERFDFSGAGERAILERVHSLDLRQIDRAIESHGRGEIDRIDLGGVLFTNTLADIPDASIDVHLSNAVLEHIPDLEACARDLARITSENCAGYHLVDFLDHRHYDDRSIAPFEKYYDGVLDEINGFTPSEVERFLASNGWNLNKCTLQTVPDEYFAREQRSIISRYAMYPRTELNQYLNCYELKKSTHDSLAKA